LIFHLLPASLKVRGIREIVLAYAPIALLEYQRELTSSLVRVHLQAEDFVTTDEKDTSHAGQRPVWSEDKSHANLGRISKSGD
jgi:hypothetical protein